jgi:glycosyltransferase involved in cell wall biosynthesis
MLALFQVRTLAEHIPQAKPENLAQKHIFQKYMTPFFSIIIPVYNVAQYLGQCLDSIVLQDFKSWELICINDGSNDGSGDILSQYGERHKQIRIENIENSGTATARNRGLKLAKGQYVLFVDSDDWIEPNTLQVIYDALVNNPLDILSFNGFLYHENSGKKEEDKGHTVNNTNGWEYYNQHVLRPRKFHFVCVVIRAYSLSFMKEKDLFFRAGILHEDNLFIPQAFYHADQVAEIPDPLYWYRLRPGSKMHELSFRQIMDKCEVNNSLGDFFFTKPGIDTTIISKIIASDYINLFGIKAKKALGKKQKEVFSNINREHFKSACQSRRHRFLYWLIRIHPSMYRAYMRIIDIFHPCFR